MATLREIRRHIASIKNIKFFRKSLQMRNLVRLRSEIRAIKW